MAKVETYDQVSAAPTNKVAAAGIGGSITIVIVYMLGLGGVDLPAEVASALTAIISFASGYLVREKRVVK